MVWMAAGGGDVMLQDLVIRMGYLRRLLDASPSILPSGFHGRLDSQQASAQSV